MTENKTLSAEPKKNLLFYFLISFFISVISSSLFWPSFLGNQQLKQEQKDLPSFLPEISLMPSPVLPQITLSVTGDVMLARSVTAKMRTLGDFSYPFAKTASVLKNADITLINLESPLGVSCPSQETGMKFCADYRAIKGLIDSGVDLVSLANNHALDQGETGLIETIDWLKENFILPLGLREPVFWEIKGLKLVFLAYNAVRPQSNLISWADPEVVSSQIRRFKPEADILIVFFHWGKEYESQPMTGGGCPMDPKELAHQAIEAGADLVLGSHPHVVQTTEWYQGKLIVYSLGNFIFDQNWSAETKRGIVGKFILNKKDLVSARFLPIIIKDYQPRWLDEAEAASGSARLE